MTELRTALQELLDAEQQFEVMLRQPLMQYSAEARAVRERLDVAIATAREALVPLRVLEERVDFLSDTLDRALERIEDLEQRIPNP